MRCNLPFVNGYPDRYGKWRYWFRRKGKRIPLPGNPSDVEFLKAYAECMAPPSVPAAAVTSLGNVEGSFEQLCRKYKISAGFTQLSTDNKRNMGYVIDALIRDHGHKPAKLLRRKHVIDMKDELAHKPGSCNNMLRVMRIICKYGVDIEMMETNVADNIDLMKVGEHRAWKDNELTTFEKMWKIGTVERFIFDTGLYSGQRAADMAAMERAQINGQFIVLKQKKTGKDMVLRIHASWQASMDAYLPTHNAPTLIAGRDGKPISRVRMAEIFRDACRKAKLPEDCVLHGLRKTTARVIAELGKKSSPVTGHMTRAMQEKYERDAEQKGLADEAIKAWERKKKVTNSKK